PVTHIWFVKGTPSKLGLLLDMSPRNLERVLYFAQYMITEVDEEARQMELMRLREEMGTVIDERVADVRPRRLELEQQLEEADAKLQAQLQDRIAAIDAEYERARDALQSQIDKASAYAEAHAGEKVEEPIVIGDTEIVKAGGKITKNATARITREGTKQLSALEKEAQKRRAAEQAVVDGAMEDAKAGLADELHPLQEKEQAIQNEIEEQYRERIQDLEDLADPIRDDRVVLLT